MTRSIAVPATRTVQQYGPVVVSLAAAAGLSLLLRGYLYPRPLFLLALVLGTWGHGLGPSLVGAGLSGLRARRGLGVPGEGTLSLKDFSRASNEFQHHS